MLNLAPLLGFLFVIGQTLALVVGFNWYSDAKNDLEAANAQVVTLSNTITEIERRRDEQDRIISDHIRERDEARTRADRLARELASLDQDSAYLSSRLSRSVLVRLFEYRGETLPDDLRTDPGDMDGPDPGSPASVTVAEYISYCEAFVQQANSDRAALRDWSNRYRGLSNGKPE